MKTFAVIAYEHPDVYKAMLPYLTGLCPDIENWMVITSYPEYRFEFPKFPVTSIRRDGEILSQPAASGRIDEVLGDIDKNKPWGVIYYGEPGSSMDYSPTSTIVRDEFLKLARTVKDAGASAFITNSGVANYETGDVHPSTRKAAQELNLDLDVFRGLGRTTGEDKSVWVCLSVIPTTNIEQAPTIPYYLHADPINRKREKVLWSMTIRNRADKDRELLESIFHPTPGISVGILPEKGEPTNAIYLSIIAGHENDLVGFPELVQLHDLHGVGEVGQNEDYGYWRFPFQYTSTRTLEAVNSFLCSVRARYLKQRSL